MLKATTTLVFYSGATGSTLATTVTCNTQTGATTTVYVGSPSATSVTFTVTSSAPSILAVTTSGSQTLASATSRIAIVLTPTAGCDGFVAGGPVTLSINGTGVTGSASLTTAITGTTGLTTPGLSSPLTVNLTCVLNNGTYYPGPAQTVSVASTAAGGTPFSVSSTSQPWLVVGSVTPASSIAPSSGAPATFTLQALGGTGSNACDSLTGTSGSGSTVTGTVYLVNTGTSLANIPISVVLQMVAAAPSSLVVTPSPITVTCTTQTVLGTETWTPSYPQTALVTSAATGGTVFTVDNTTGNTPPAWLTVVAPTGTLTASSSPVPLTFQAAAGCNGLTGLTGSTSVTGTVKLASAGYQDKVIPVTLQIVPATVLKATPATASFTYVKGSGTAGYADVSISDASGATTPYYFTVNAATLPSWLRVDFSSGTTTQSLRFSSTSVADTLAPGTYMASVLISVSAYGDLTLPISMLLTNKAPTLSVEGSTTVPISWTIGQGLPTATVTVLSTDTPIAYSATTGGVLQPVIAAGEQNGLAYSFGTPINVSFGSQPFASAQPGATLTGTLTLTYGTPASTIVVTFDVSVLSPQAIVTAISPSGLPVQPGPYTYPNISLIGTGFVVSTNAALQTKVGIVTGSGLIFDTNISATVLNQSNISVTIVEPSGGDMNIPFAGGTLTLGVCNPVGGICTLSGQQPLTFGTNPIVQAVTSSSSLIEGESVSVAPYDIISIFGTNFCPGLPSSGAGSVLTNAAASGTLTYPATLACDSTHSITVRFQTTASTPVFIANAPILFATNTQINLLVPSAVFAEIGSGAGIVVSLGSGAFGSGTQKSSAVFPVNIAATDPGIFTIGEDGQGSAAALDANYNLISATNPAGTRSGSGVSDTIAIYMTGLGAPNDSVLSNNASTTGDFGGLPFASKWLSTQSSPSVTTTDCVTTASYITAFNSAQGTSITTLDGTLIIPSVLNPGRLIPCISSTSADVPVVTIGGAAATVTYAGWVPDTIAGLYQVNVLLPNNGTFTTTAGTNQTITAPVQFPVTMTSNGVSSQTGVTLWVAPRLLVVGPSSLIVNSANVPNTVSATVGTALPSLNNSVTATLGTGSITYAVTSGLLPSGLSLDPSSGLISGTPAAGTQGTYTVTVTATDSANVPVTGTVTFVVTVSGGLFMTTSTPVVSTFGTGNTGVTTVAASGGVFPYTYSMANTLQSGGSPLALPTGLAIDSMSGVVTTSAMTPAGSYTVVVKAVDSTGGTALVGYSTFTVVVNLNITAGAYANGAAGVMSTIEAAATATNSGATGTVAYALDSVTAALPWVTFNTSTGVLGITTGAGAGTYPVTITATDGTTPTLATAPGTWTHTFNMTITP